MATLVEFLVRLVTSAIDLARIFIFDVALQDPIALVTWLVGGLLTTAAILAFAYLALGALAKELGITATAPPAPHERQAE